ncbi:MAG: helix-turn-helix domain-containing protein [Balneolales bacterium]
MNKIYHNPGIDARLIITDDFNNDDLFQKDSNMMFLWNDGSQPFTLRIDDQPVILGFGRIICTTYLQRVRIEEKPPVRALKILLFNREFYCVHTHDSEVSCNGLLFFGSDFSPILTLDSEETCRLRTLFSVLEEELGIRDANQEEMLRILLKRFIIRCTRLARKQLLRNDGKQEDIDLVRHFNVLVEKYFKTNKTVADYAGMLHKSPKTIANVFGKYSKRTPLQVIHKRVLIEAKRLLLYTDKSVKEIAMELGYEDPAQFSKWFKSHEGKTATEYRQVKSRGIPDTTI